MQLLRLIMNLKENIKNVYLWNYWFFYLWLVEYILINGKFCGLK